MSRSGGQPVVARQKAHTAMLEVLAEWGIEPRSATPRQLAVATTEALCRAIEQHEAFKQEVSDAVEGVLRTIEGRDVYNLKYPLSRFIIPKPKPDPLAGVLEEVFSVSAVSGRINAALEARKLEIREKGQ